jgi:hypothetical protein
MHHGALQTACDPATLFTNFRFDRTRLDVEAETAIACARELQRSQPDVKGWIISFLGNQSGDHADMRLVDYPGSFRPTSLARTMPYTMEIIRQLREEGFSFQYCRIAVLEKRSLLRCHVDMYTSARLILPLTEQGDDFRHVFENQCFGMRVGDLWGIDGNVCHGAAHVGDAGYRVSLLLDAAADPAHLPAWWRAPWSIPDGRLIRRLNWDRAARDQTRASSESALARGGDPAAVEQEWLLLPFEYEVMPSTAYAELIEFCEHRGRRPGAADRSFWLGRADHWRQRNCRCV